MHHRIGIAVATAILATCAFAADRKNDAKEGSDTIREHGRYVVSFAACNDCPLHHLTETDLRGIYRFFHVLGPAGNPAAACVPPNQEPKPFVTFPAPPK